MSAVPAISLRDLLREDIARALDRQGMRAAARLLRRTPLGNDDTGAVCDDVRRSLVRPSEVSVFHALGALHRGNELLAVAYLAEERELDRAAWIAATCEEQGVTLVTP